MERRTNMSVEDYKKSCDDIMTLYRLQTLEGCLRALDMLHSLMEIYVQDGALPGVEPFYGQVMVTKAQLIMLTIHIVRAQPPTSPDS